jgi:hypothetical protein
VRITPSPSTDRCGVKAPVPSQPPVPSPS